MPSSYDYEPGENPQNGVSNGITKYASPDGSIMEKLLQSSISKLDRSLENDDYSTKALRSQLDILRTENDVQSRKVMELNSEISRIKRDAADEMTELRRSYEDEISKLKDQLSTLKSEHREELADLKDEIRTLTFEKNHSSTWMDRIMENAGDVLPMIQKLFEKSAESAPAPQLAAAAPQAEPEKTAMAPEQTQATTMQSQQPSATAPANKEELVLQLMRYAGAMVEGQEMNEQDYANTITGMVGYAKTKGWQFSAEEYVTMAEKLVDFAVQHSYEAVNVAKAVYPLFADLKVVKTTAKVMSVDNLTDTLLSMVNKNADSYPESHLSLLKNVLSELKKLL